MSVRRLSLLGRMTVLLFVAACSGGEGPDGTTGPSVPEFMQKTAGDEQTGPAGTVLPAALEVKVTDRSGRAISGFTVSFAAAGGSVNPQSMSTDANGLARTVATLPNATASMTVTATGAGLTAQTFTLHAVAAQLTINETFLPAGRRGLPYTRKVTGTGGSSGGYTFAVASGTLPAGVSLAADGSFSGTPTQTGSFPFSIRIRDSGGTESTKAVTIQVCEPAAAMAVGEVRVVDPTVRGGCGVFLPAGAPGDRYRVAIVNTSASPGDSEQTGSLWISGMGVGVATAQVAAAPAGSTQARPLTAGFGELAERLRRSRAAHSSDLRANVALLERLGTSGRLENRPRPSLAASVMLPEKLRLNPTTTSGASCSAQPQVTALLIAEDAKLAIYQDSAQNAATATRVTPAMAQKLLDTFKYSDTVTRTYFGGVPDTDNNGKVIAFVTPSIGSGVLGKVFSGDFLTKSQCPASNQGEYIYLHVETALALATPTSLLAGTYILAHEMKHVASLWQRTERARRTGDNAFNPEWEEEGLAEVAAERAARYAWGQLGGPLMNVLVGSTHIRTGPTTTAITQENEAMLWMFWSAQDFLGHQPNSVVKLMPGAPADYLYSSGWIFGRWLGDAYGGSASGSELADSALYRRLNDWSTPSGPSGVQTVTGKTWPELMVEFAAAAMANGRLTTVPRGFTSYDILTSLEVFCFAHPPNSCEGYTGPTGRPGGFPWPVTTDPATQVETRSFADAGFAGAVGPSGMRIHDFTSNGTGQGAEINVEMPGAKVVVLRLR